MSHQPISIVLGGGLDLVSAPMTIKPGRLIDALNYESVIDGYRRMDGFERMDGRPKPSLASYWLLTFNPTLYAPAANDLLTGAISGATGRVLEGVTAGLYQAVLTDVVGLFLPNEFILVASVIRAQTAGAAVERGAPDDATDLVWYDQAVAVARSRIMAVPGSGPIRGVWIYNGARYAFRNAPDALSCVMWKATPNGWTQQSLGRMLAFTAGAVGAIPEGATITGATSGATAIVRRTVTRGGSYSASAATGYLMVASQTGAFGNEDIRVGAVVRGHVAGNSAAVTLQPGGRYRFDNHNFYGASNQRRMYGVSGVDYAFEWDGSTFTPIITGMPIDKPTHLACHKLHLFLGFPGGSLQNSGIGEPLSFQAVLGASEIGLGDDITGLLPEYVDTLIVFGRTQTSALYGTSSSDFALRPIATDAGAIEWTAQIIGTPHYFDDAGLRSMSTTQAYGNFGIGTLSDAILPLLKGKERANVRPIASMRVRGKSQYRLFFDDGTGLTVYLAKKAPEFVPFDLGGVIPTCSCAAEDAAGDETLLIGDGTGLVYELDAGTSHDGVALDSYVQLAAHNMGSPTRNKTFPRVEFQLETEALTEIGVVPVFTSPNDESPVPADYKLALSGGKGGYWDQFLWNNFFWSSQAAGLAFATLDGFGRDIALTVLCNSAKQRPHTLKALTYHYSMRGLAK